MRGPPVYPSTSRPPRPVPLSRRAGRPPRRPRRRPLDDGARSHVVRDDRVRPDARARADAHPAQDRCSRPQHRTRLDSHRARDQLLKADGDLDVVEALVEVGDHDFVAQHAPLADEDARPGGDRAAVAEHRTLTDRHRACVDVQAAALAERRAVTHDHACSGSDLEPQSRPEQRPAAQLDATALTHAHAQRAQAMAHAEALERVAALHAGDGAGWIRDGRWHCSQDPSGPRQV